jgi:hypothetical protein
MCKFLFNRDKQEYYVCNITFNSSANETIFLN